MRSATTGAAAGARTAASAWLGCFASDKAAAVVPPSTKKIAAPATRLTFRDAGERPAISR
jgi:hypothetical protein